MATIVHFDITASDPERAKKFYETLFGWNIGQIDGFPDYYEIETTQLNGMKGPGGGITRRENALESGVTNFIGVASIDETIEKLRKLGGTVIQPKQALKGYGFLAVCTDTENNFFGLFQEDKKAG